jgi:hypothetical protein
VDLSPIDRVYVKFPVTGKLADGSAATVTGVDVALLPFRTDPATVTTWTPAAYADGIASVLLAGPAADPSGALPVPVGGAELWARVTDTPEVQAVRVGFISVS